MIIFCYVIKLSENLIYSNDYEALSRYNIIIIFHFRLNSERQKYCLFFRDRQTINKFIFVSVHTYAHNPVGGFLDAPPK